MKILIASLTLLLSCSSFAEDMGASDYNQKRAVALIDAKLLGQKEALALGMDRYKIVSDINTSKSNDVTVGVASPGSECTVLVRFKDNGSIVISEEKCQPGT